MSSVGFQCRLSLKTRTTCSLRTTLQHFPLTFFEVQVVHYCTIPPPHVLEIPSMKPIFQVAILWLAVILLGVITEIAYVASSTRADCGKINRSTSMSLIINFFRSDTCTIKERISTLVHGQSSYFQSAHIIIVHAIAGVALTLFKPSLSAMIWSTLESSESRTTGTPV